MWRVERGKCDDNIKLDFKIYNMKQLMDLSGVG